MMNHQTAPLFFRDREEAKLRKPYVEIVDNSELSPFERLDAYWNAIKPKYTKKAFYRGNEFPTVTFLGELFQCSTSTVSRMQEATMVHREDLEILFHLAAIFPAPAPGQTPREARQVRLEIAADWLKQKDQIGMSLLEWLKRKSLASESA